MNLVCHHVDILRERDPETPEIRLLEKRIPIDFQELFWIYVRERGHKRVPTPPARITDRMEPIVVVFTLFLFRLIVSE